MFGNDFSGIIIESRLHACTRELTVVTIQFDKPTFIGIKQDGYNREFISMNVETPVQGDTKWQDGHGGFFEVQA